MIAIGDTIQGRIAAILPGGEAVLHVDGASVLVNNAVPGDVVAVHVTAKRRGVWRGELTEILEASDKRIAMPCPVANLCGGCALQALSPTEQADLKSAWVTDAFDKLIEADTAWMPCTVHDNRYRRRLRWFVGSDRQELYLGFYAQASHQSVRHQTCMVLTPELNALRSLIEQQVNLHGVTAVQAVQLSDGIHVIIEAECAPVPVDIRQVDGIDLQWWWRADAITRPLKKPALRFHELLPAGGSQVQLQVGPDGFVQGQMQGNRELIEQIQQWAGPANRIADLFCGIGNLSLPLAAATGAEVFGAELNEASVRAATANAKTLNIKAQFEVANLFESFDMVAYIGADVLILDPPRRGAKRLCSQMGRLLPKKIIMISCDSAAGSRDGAILQQHGYRLKALRALDLFPFAGHVEAMSLWEQV